MQHKFFLYVQFVALLSGTLTNGEPSQLRLQQQPVPPALAQTHAASSYEEYPSDVADFPSTLDRSAFFKSPSSWFLPSLKKWQRLPVAYGRTPNLAGLDYASSDGVEIEDDVKRGNCCKNMESPYSR